MNIEQLAEIIRCRSNWDEVADGFVLELDPDPLFNLHILRQDGWIIGINRTYCWQADSQDVGIEQIFDNDGPVEEEAFQIAAELFLVIARIPYLRKSKGESKYVAHRVDVD